MLICNQTDPNQDIFLLQPCFENQDINQITLCFRKVITHLTGIWRAESNSAMALPAFITQLFVILTINRILTLALRRFHIPRIAAEILGGIILGPSALGFTDVVTKYILPWGTLETLENVASLGLVYFMFIVGLEVDLKPVLRAGKKPLTTALAGILLPFPIGVTLHHFFIEDFNIISKNHANRFGPFFWGLALATTNFPDLAGLLADLKLLHTDVGRTSLTSAVVSDILCWFLFVLTMAISHQGRVYTLVTTSVFIVVCIFAIRPALKWALRKSSKEENYDQRHVCFIMAGVLLFAFITDACGSHSILGAFMFGLILPRGEIKTLVVESTEEFVSELLIPLFFFCIGLRFDRHWMYERGVGGGDVLLVVVLAFVAKILSTFLVAYFVNRMSARDGVALGLLMNTKGLLSLVIINTGRDLLALDMQTFAVILLALWIMTAVVGPILSLTYNSKRRRGGLFTYRTVRSIEGNSEFRILACLHSTRTSGGLISLLRAANPSTQSPVAVFAVHLVELIGHTSAMLIVHDAMKPSEGIGGGGGEGGAVGEALDALRSETFSVQSLTAVSAYSTMHEDICSLAEDKRATLILLPFHIGTAAAEGGAAAATAATESTAESPFRLVNRNVLDNAPCSVAVFIDRGLGSSVTVSDDDPKSPESFGIRHHFAVLFIGGKDDREALAYAWRMAKSSKVALTVLRFVPSKTALENNPNILRGFASESDDYHEGGNKNRESIMEAIAESERERPIDEQYIEEFRLKTRDDASMRLIEAAAENGEDVVRIVSSADTRYDLYVVGRGKGGVSPLISGLSEWSEYPELGPLGDILVCSSFAAEASVLVVQQGAGGAVADDAAAVGRVREQFGHMTWHAPENTNATYAPFIHRRVRVADEDDHL